ncbi:acyltransferase family protein [Actinomycetaceae bacterium L2_0104]
MQTVSPSDKDATPAVDRPTVAAKTSSTGFIPEVQGLRTVALLLVAVFHIWFGKVSGGVDIFLLVSSYLMTRSLVAKSEAGAITRPVSFLLKKFARLLPAAAISIALILVAVFVFMPADTWRGSTGDAFASLGYFQNIHLQQAAVDYFNADHSTASPFQHFWSLSVQGQVFVLWAFLHLAGDLISRALRLRPRLVLLAIFSTVAIVSFAYSVHLTAENQTYAYFDTWARLWEFAAGSVLALVQPWLRLSTGLRTVIGWLGVLGMVSCGFVLPVQSSFPGVAALWPVLSAALVILSAGKPTAYGADRFLARGVLNRIGSYTYALYLVHWPVLVIFLWKTNSTQATFLQGLFVLAVSAVISVLITVLVDRPSGKWVSRLSSPAKKSTGKHHASGGAGSAGGDGKSRQRRVNSRAAVVIVASIAVAAAPAAGLREVQKARAEDNQQALENLDYAAIGANDPALTGSGDPVPDWSIVKDDWTSLGADCAEGDPYAGGLCYNIPTEDGSEPERKVLIIGSSHATQFGAALLEVVNRHPNWEFRAQVAPSCYFHIRSNISDTCAQMWDATADYIDEVQPDMVVVYGTLSKEDRDETMPTLLEWITERKAIAPETAFVVLRDNPRIGFSMSECAQSQGIDDPSCTKDVPNPTMDGYASNVEATGAIWMDLTESICPDYQCRPVVGGVVTYFDAGHMTETFVRTLSGDFSRQIHERVDWWPANPYEGEYVNRAGDGDVVDDLNSGS